MNYSEEELEKIHTKKNVIFHDSTLRMVAKMSGAQTVYFFKVIEAFRRGGEMPMIQGANDVVVQLAFEDFYANYLIDTDNWIKRIRGSAKGGKASSKEGKQATLTRLNSTQVIG